jgi:hypothetical protein
MAVGGGVSRRAHPRLAQTWAFTRVLDGGDGGRTLVVVVVVMGREGVVTKV